METPTNAPSRAVLWDMDGTLLDSAEYHWLAWRDALAQEKVAWTYDRFLETFGQRNDTILRDIFGQDISDSEIARIGDAKEQLYRSLVRSRGIDLLPGVKDWLVRLNGEGWRQAIASAAPRANIDTILHVLQIAWCFDAIVSAEDVKHGKPDPQVFLLAAERVGVPPARCVVVEDAPAGVEGAHRGGMRAIGVRSSHGHIRADVTIDRLDQLPDDTFSKLIEGT